MPIFLNTPSERELFIKEVYAYYNDHKRSFLWRETKDSYHIVVSEIMLQQTQTSRVETKYKEFIEAYPTINALALAPLSSVLESWSGLGYNRRALALHELARRVVSEFNGKIPDEPSILQTFKGIGPATAASICAFAYNKPTLFIETNIRAVFIHSFFDQEKVHDRDIMPLVQETVDTVNPRQWYYALMDYGVMLKKNHSNPSRKSVHHTKQSRFEGSDRQVRGLILKQLIHYTLLSAEELYGLIPREQAKIEQILKELEQEGFIKQNNNRFCLTR